MQNFGDYSQFIHAAYCITGLTLMLLFTFVVMRYFSAKSKIKNEK